MIELIEHTGELEMRVSAPTQQSLDEEALRGPANEVSDAASAEGREHRRVEITSSGPDTLLADLLNEAICLMDVDGFVATHLVVERLEEATLRGSLVGVRDPRARPLAKAATHHGLVVRPVEDGWEGRVVLDV